MLENGGYIIEDAPYSELYFTQKAQSISSMLPNNTLHLGSFSKTLAPSLRVGWVRANKEIIKELLKIKETIDLHTCSIAQHTLNNYLQTQYRYKMHLKNLRINYRQKMEFFADALEKYLPVFKFARPEGGMFIYGYIEGVDSFRLVQECIKEKVVFVPANQFYLNEKISNEIRFNFTHTDEENTIKGLKKIAIILSKYR
ncbi:aminotransferase class I/II-fold pyridoxal phosphate-dependent enzyme [Sulfurimonas sp.]